MLATTITHFDTILVLGLTAVGIFLLRRFSSRKPLPPGPSRLPLIGNLLDVPPTQQWKVFASWGDKWGKPLPLRSEQTDRTLLDGIDDSRTSADVPFLVYSGGIISMALLRQPIIIVNSSKIAIELLEKRSAIYSDRPVLMMGGETVGWKNILGLTQNGPRFRSHRKLIFRTIGNHENMKRYYPSEEQETKKFLARVLACPSQLSSEIRKMAGAIILKISYGYQVKEHDDQILDVVNKAMAQFSLCIEPGAFLVDVIPALRFVPGWFPGTGWKKTAAVWAKTLSDMSDIPYNFVKEQMAAGTALPSFTSELLGNPKVTLETEFDIKWSAAALFVGGADTSVSAINSFFLAMSLYPEVQKKAQAEIDAVIGNNRLPTFSDQDHLPYVRSLVKEVFRWSLIAPLGLAHRVNKDDMYEGYFIPAGAYVFPNIWKFLHDPEVYSNPAEFNPERFMGTSPEANPEELCFGFGRRICPGKNMAVASVFISCVMSLAVFNVSKGLDESGREIEPIVEYTDGVVSHPKPFKCTIKPRSQKSIALISSA